MMLSDVCLSVWRLTSVAYIGPKSRTERPRKTRIGTEVAHVTRDSDTTQGQKVKGQDHQAALITAALTRQAAAAVSVGTFWEWESTATLRSAGAVGSAVGGASAPTEGERRGHSVADAHPQLVYRRKQWLKTILKFAFFNFIHNNIDVYDDLKFWTAGRDHGKHVVLLFTLH